MTRRYFLWLGIVGAVAARLGIRVAEAQDVQYIRAMERAQSARPTTLVSTARIAPTSEPGDPLVVRGRLFDVGGAAAAGAIVFAYHTDKGGLYDTPGKGPHSWRLRGWAKTGQDGSFTFETIRPGAYPGGNIPPHVHFTAFLPNGERYHTPQVDLAARPDARPGQVEEIAADLRLRAGDRF